MITRTVCVVVKGLSTALSVFSVGCWAVCRTFCFSPSPPPSLPLALTLSVVCLPPCTCVFITLCASTLSPPLHRRCASKSQGARCRPRTSADERGALPFILFVCRTLVALTSHATRCVFHAVSTSKRDVVMVRHGPAPAGAAHGPDLHAAHEHPYATGTRVARVAPLGHHECQGTAGCGTGA